MTAQGGPGYEAHDEATLGRLVASGDRRALEEIYDRTAALSYSLALRVVTDEAVAAGVVAGAFAAVWRGAARYDGSRGPLGTWLLAVTHRKAVEVLRRTQSLLDRREPGELITDLDRWLDAAADGGASLHEPEQRRIRAVVDAMPVSQRTALLLAYFGGYSQPEIALVTGSALGSVQSDTLEALVRVQEVVTDGDVWWTRDRDHDTSSELAAAHVLSCLEDDDEAAYLEHSGLCARCQQLEREVSGVLRHLVRLTPSVEPGSTLKEKVLLALRDHEDHRAIASIAERVSAPTSPHFAAGDRDPGQQRQAGEHGDGEDCERD